MPYYILGITIFYLNILFVHSTSQHVYFLFGQEPPVAPTNILFRQPGKLYTIKSDHTVAQRLEDAAYNTVFTAVYLNANLRLFALVNIFYGVSMHLAVF